ncbi:hypothetical protein, partial [Lacticaseibacillus paracasei]
VCTAEPHLAYDCSALALRSLSPISLSVREMIFRKIRKSFLFFVNANGIEISFCVLKSQNVLTFEELVLY